MGKWNYFPGFFSVLIKHPEKLRLGAKLGEGGRLNSGIA